MNLNRKKIVVAGVGFLAVAMARRASAAPQLGDIFVIDLENHNWIQPDGNVENATNTGGTAALGGIQQIYHNSAAPFINSLVTPGNAAAAQTSFTNSYYNVLATPTGTNPSIHPSEPNYLWQESGTNFGVANDNDPYGSTNQVNVINSYLTANPSVSGQNVTGLLQNKGVSWKSYQEDTDLATTGVTETNGNQAAFNGHLTANSLTSTAVTPGQYTVPLASFSGTSSNYINSYNSSHQYNFAAKHDGQLFFNTTNGGNNGASTNVEAAHYAPIQSLASDLTNNTVGQYNLITPDQYNDMHTALTGGFTYNGVAYTGDAAQIAQGDNFLATVVPQIEASQAYKNNGAIIIWTDETEPDSTNGAAGDLNQNDYNHSLSEIIISPLAKGNAYLSNQIYTHSSDLAFTQDVFQAPAQTANGYLNDAATPGTANLSDFFVAGVVPSSVPEPTSLALLSGGIVALLVRRRRA